MSTAVITREMSETLDAFWLKSEAGALAVRRFIQGGSGFKRNVFQRVYDAITSGLRALVVFALASTSQTALVTLLFQNTAMANVGNSGGLQPSSAAGSFFLSLHTANPGVTGTQTTSEAAYTSYARVAVARSSGGWTVTGTQPCVAENAAAATFPAATGGTETETYFGIGTATSGAGQLLISAALTSSLAVASGITPSFAINACQFNAT
jgi:hypothetical protein